MKNPKECFSIVQNQTFIVLNELTRPECRDGSEPLTFHHETFSRFNFVIISADKKATTANIPVREIPGIFEKVHDLKMKHLLTARPVSEGASESPAYTTIINAGKLKGKTPAAALAEDGAKGESLLKSQVQWLKQNLAAYPRNAVQIQAIEAALQLYHEGRLNQQEAQKGCVETETIYRAELRPLTRRKKGDKCFVYSIYIRWNPGAERPIEIEIVNFYAPVVKTDKGLLNVLAKEKTNEVRNRFSLTIDQWCWLEHILEANIRTFENEHAGSLYRMAEEEKKRGMEAFRNSNGVA